MRINLLVIRTLEPEKLKVQYEGLGFEFEYHRHGNGPFHYASEQNGFVFEIYPLTKSMNMADNSIRLGFEIESLDLKMDILKEIGWDIVTELKETEWGGVALVKDLDGRKVELINKERSITTR